MKMMSFPMLALFLALTLDTITAGAVNKDVCILGAGASGMASAVYLKDRGYDVVVLEKESEIAGHCDTQFVVPPSPSDPNYFDIGVIYFPDTVKLEQVGFGPFQVDTAGFVKRFAGNDSLQYVNFRNVTHPTYLMDVQSKLFLGPQPTTPPTLQFLEAYQRFGLLLQNYSWLTLPVYPDPIPAELLLPFDQWLVQNNLTALVGYFNQWLQIGGMGAFQNLTTLYALGFISPATFFFTNNPNYGFTVKGGCVSIYNGIQNYLGVENVLVNVTIEGSLYNILNQLFPQISLGWNVQLLGMNTYTKEPIVYNCGSVFVAYPQTADAMNFLHLTSKQRNLFSQVQTRFYFDGLINITGPLAQNNNGFSFLNLNPADPFLTPKYPTVTQFERIYSYGPSAVWGAAEQFISPQDMETIVTQQISSTIPTSVFNSAQIEKLNLHIYQPYVPVTSLQTSPNFYTNLTKIQGDRFTYYVGALPSYASSFSVWEHASRLIANHFPNKTKTKK